MVYYKITLMRSLIGTPHTTRTIIKTIGLGKRCSTVYRKVTPHMAGTLLKVKEMVDVELTDKPLSREEQRIQRKSNPGYEVVREDNDGI